MHAEGAPHVLVLVPQAGVRPKKSHADDAVAAVRARSIPAAVLSYASAGKAEEALEFGLKELDGIGPLPSATVCCATQALVDPVDAVLCFPLQCC